MSTPIKIALGLLGVALLFGKLLYDLYCGATENLQPNLANDAITHGWPFLSYAKASVGAGIAPLWNPYTSLGTPLLAEIGLGLFFPLAWVILLADVAAALLVIQFLTVAVGMVGMYCYTRHVRLEPLAGVACVVLFAFALFTETFYPTMGYSFCMLPFVLWLAHRMLNDPQLRSAGHLALAIALCFLGGFPNYFIYTVLLVGVYCALLLAFLYPDIRVRGVLLRLGMALLVATLMLGLVAVQLAPAIELSSLSYRNIDSGSAYDPNSLWENFSLPLLLGNFIQTDLTHVFGNSVLRLPASISYLGGVLLFLPFAFLARSLRPVALALAASGVFLCLFLLSYQLPALALLQKLPFAAAIRVNGRAAGYVQFALIVLCCMGLSNLVRLARGELAGGLGRLRAPLLLAWAAFAAWLAYAAFARNDSLLFAPGFAACGALVAIAAGARPRTRFAIGSVVALLLFALLDIGYHRQNRFLVPAFHPGADDTVAAARAAIGANPQQQRLVFVEQNFEQSALLANLGPKHRLPSIDAYIGLTSSRWENYVRFMLGPEEFDRLVALSPLQRFYGYFSPRLLQAVLARPEILRLASLRYVIAGEDVSELPDPLPRAYAVSHYVRTNTEEETLAAIRATRASMGDTVVLESASPGFPARSRRSQPGSVVIERYSSNEVVLNVRTADHALVVLTDAYYPGWVASLDGAETPILRANSLFRAVEVAPGEHTVVFRYRPIALYVGAGLTFASILLLAIMLTGRRA